MPRRRDPDPAISIRYVDAHAPHLLRRPPRRSDPRGSVRRTTATRPHREPRADGVLKDMVPGISLRLGDRWAHAVSLERPIPREPTAKRDRSLIGTATRRCSPSRSLSPTRRMRTASRGSGSSGLPFAQVPLAEHGHRPSRSTLPRRPAAPRLHLRPAASAGPARLGLRVSLVNFEMIAYDHRGARGDYSPSCASSPRTAASSPTSTSPSSTPRSGPRSCGPVRGAGSSTPLLTLGSGLNPSSTSWSRPGWDAEGWADPAARLTEAPPLSAYAWFTILGVGNNPGIHIVAAGAVLMAVGIPWAFTSSPGSSRRRKAKVQAQLAAGA